MIPEYKKTRDPDRDRAFQLLDKFYISICRTFNLKSNQRSQKLLAVCSEGEV